MQRISCWSVGLLLASMALPRAAHADDRFTPKTGTESTRWEFGLGATAVHLPHYIGSDEAHDWLLPFPFFVYRSEHLNVDRNFVHGEIFSRGRFSVDLSLSGAPPVKSADNHARRGMADLDATGEFGPVLQYSLSHDAAHQWQVDLALRQTAASDLHSVSNAGQSATLRLNYTRVLSTQEGVDWRWESSVGGAWGSARQHDFFYGVSPADALADRPLYQAEAGFSGWRWTVGMTRRHGNFWAGAFVRAWHLDDAVFANSPLVRERDSVAFGIAMAWIFKSSPPRN